MPVIRYRCKCQDCKHEWTSHRDSGTPEYCPQCRSRMIGMSPLVSQK
jgi:Zn finger protein HypA/HybF involved in hydrogenase expression